MKKTLCRLSVLASVALLIMLSGCSSGKSSSYNALKSTVGAAYNTPAGAQDQATAEKVAASSGSSDSAASDTAKAANNRKIIMNGNISLQSATYAKATAGIEALVSQYGGFIQSSNVQGSGKAGDRTAAYTVRIPSAKLDSFLNGVGDFGKVVSKSKSGQDVTQQYYDTDTHLTTLRAEKARILDILSKTQNMSDLLTIEQRLTNIDNQIESLTGELQKMDSLVEMSTVTINISEVTEISNTPDNFFGQVGAVAVGSLKALLTTLSYIVIVIVAVLPFAIVFGGVALALYFIMRHRKKANNAVKSVKKEAEEPEKTEDQ